MKVKHTLRYAEGEPTHQATQGRDGNWSALYLLSIWEARMAGSVQALLLHQTILPDSGGEWQLQSLSQSAIAFLLAVFCRGWLILPSPGVTVVSNRTTVAVSQKWSCFRQHSVWMKMRRPRVPQSYNSFSNQDHCFQEISFFTADETKEMLQIIHSRQMNCWDVVSLICRVPLWDQQPDHQTGKTQKVKLNKYRRPDTRKHFESWKLIIHCLVYCYVEGPTSERNQFVH